MRDCFGLTVDGCIYFGGYPGAVEMMQDEARWKVYVRNSMIDATVNREIFEDVRIGKAALLRKTLELGAAYSGKILSLTKLLGEIQDAGNVMTIAGYLERLNQCGLLGTFQKFSVDDARRRASIPKFQVHNNAHLTALSAGTFEQVRNDPVKWGHYVESAVGAYLISQAYPCNLRCSIGEMATTKLTLYCAKTAKLWRWKSRAITSGTPKDWMCFVGSSDRMSP